MISAAMLKTQLTGVDANTSFMLMFSETLQAQVILSCSINVQQSDSGVTIHYRNGNILIHPPIHHPKSFMVQYFDKPGSGDIVKEERRVLSYIGTGLHFKADEVTRCVRDGKLESEIWSHEKSLMVMDIFDEVSCGCSIS